jgi:carboxyl-terminal processing protease
MFYRPDGESTQLQGVPSDVELPSLTNHLEDIMEADLDYALPASKIKPVKYPTFPYVSADMIKMLREKSAARIRENARFQREIHKIDNYMERQKQSMQTLNETKFFAEKEVNSDKDTEELEKKMLSHNIERDYYMEEVMAITIDAIEYLRNNGVEFPKEKSKPAARNIFNLFGS